MNPTQLTDQQALALFRVAFGFSDSARLDEFEVDRSDPEWIRFSATLDNVDYTLNLNDTGTVWASHDYDPAEIRPRAIIDYLDSLDDAPIVEHRIFASRSSYERATLVNGSIVNIRPITPLPNHDPTKTL